MRKVLITDDSKAVHSYLTIHLDPGLFSLDHAYDGEEAVSLVKKNQYDILLLDWEMPKLAGIDALKAIREFNDKIKIVMVTSKGQKEHIARAFGLGANGFIKKPFDPKLLQNTMQQKAANSDAPQPITVAIKAPLEAAEGKKRILLCDDDSEMLDFLSSLIEEICEAEFVFAMDGEEALNHLEQGLFDAIITDLNMPKLNGMQLIRKIKSDQNHRFTPLYIISGEVDQLIGKYAEKNLVKIINKPFDPEVLITHLESDVLAVSSVPNYHHEIIRCFMETCSDVLQGNFNVYRTGSLSLTPDSWQLEDYSSSLGIIGAGMRGHLLITCNKNFIDDLLYSLFGGDGSMIGDDSISYLGELVNQLGGRFINKLSSVSILSQITIPDSVCSKSKEDLTWLTQVDGIQIPINSATGSCNILLFLEGVRSEKIQRVEPTTIDSEIFF